MPDLTRANEKAKDLQEYIDSEHIDSISFSAQSPEINVHFSDGIRVQIPFNASYNFTGEVVIRDRKRLLSPGVAITEVNKPTLVFIFNLFDNNNFMFMCEQYIRDLWVREK